MCKNTFQVAKVNPYLENNHSVLRSKNNHTPAKERTIEPFFVESRNTSSLKKTNSLENSSQKKLQLLVSKTQ